MVCVLAFNAYRFGNPLDTGRTSAPEPHVGLPLVGLVGLAASPAESVFLYCPPYLLGLAGLWRLLRLDRRLLPVFWCLGIHVLLVATLRHWAGEWAWGPRYLVASLPLVCIGLPFAGWRPAVTRSLVVLGLVVQLLGISVDHQRYYFERSLSRYFWLDERQMYRDSPLLARPQELIQVITAGAWRHADALVPSPDPMSMTTTLVGPTADDVRNMPRSWVRRYLVFLVPRPWVVWCWYLPDQLRPVPAF
jgi:hypothetical protein